METIYIVMCQFGTDAGEVEAVEAYRDKAVAERECRRAQHESNKLKAANKFWTEACELRP